MFANELVMYICLDVLEVKPLMKQLEYPQDKDHVKFMEAAKKMLISWEL